MVLRVNPSLSIYFAPGLLIVFVLWASLLTYPLPLHLFSHIPLGSEDAATVPFFNLWTLQWNIDQQLQGYPDYWNAPIFTPDTGAFAFSEPQPLSAMLATPLWLAFGSPAFGYNALIILFLTLNGWFACWLLRSWGVSLLPAVMGGLLAQALPFVAQEMGVLQLTALFGFLWSLFFLHRFIIASRPSAPSPPCSPAPLLPRPLTSSLGLALSAPLTFFTCVYYGLFSLFFLPLALLCQVRKNHLHLKFAAWLGLIALAAFILTGPGLWAQQQQLAQYNLSRTDQTVESNSAKAEYYRNFLDDNLLYSQLLGLKSAAGQRLFPGWGLLLLAGLGLWGGPNKRVKLYLLVAVTLAFGLSLGLRLNLADFWPGGAGQLKPYQWLRDYVPGLAQLRSPFRFAALVQLHLALLAGFGLFNLGCWFRPHTTPFVVGAAALALFEMLALPLPLQPLPDTLPPTAWQTWLNERGAAPIVILPFAANNQVEAFEPTTRWMLLNRHLRGPMLNGYSGFFPPDHAHVRDLMLQFPTPAGLELLRQKGIAYVVVYHNLPGAPSLQAVEAYLPRLYVDQQDNVAIYSLKEIP